MNMEPDVINHSRASEEYHHQILNDNVMRNPDGSVSCNLCGKQFLASRRDNSLTMAKRHVELHLHVSYQCPNCDKTAKNKRSLQAHIAKYHNQ